MAYDLSVQTSLRPWTAQNKVTLSDVPFHTVFRAQGHVGSAEWYCSMRFLVVKKPIGRLTGITLIQTDDATGAAYWQPGEPSAPCHRPLKRLIGEVSKAFSLM